MTRKKSVLLVAVFVVGTLGARSVRGDVRRETTKRRPYIVEVGEPYSIAPTTLDRQAILISDLKEYIGTYGHPDYAEIQEISPEWPWESYEVRLFYLPRNLELDFGRAFLSAAMPNLGLLKFQGDISPQKRHEIEIVLQARQTLPAPVVRAAPAAAYAAPPTEPASPVAEATAPPPETGGLTEALVARIEAAAERAAQAADRAAEDSEAAVRAADRTVEIVNKFAGAAE